MVNKIWSKNLNSRCFGIIINIAYEANKLTLCHMLLDGSSRHVNENIFGFGIILEFVLP
jgi:hypothetical protein